jgi:hypothetical protein
VDVGPVDRLLEAAHELRAVERLAGLRVTEDEIPVARVDRPRAKLAERRGDPLSHGDRAAERGCFTPEAVTPARLPVPAKRSSPIDIAAWATQQ